uniref:tumor necrosis factor receptor superfamily member 1A n=1 Tax=Semicossyphus pulcher TaxID=241346 RepID=UPI0037E7EB47
MDLVFLLTLAFLSIGQSYIVLTEQTSSSCYALCPPGYHKMGACDDAVKVHRCEKCVGNQFLDRENHVKKCERCTVCGNKEVEIQPCSYNSDTKCDCPEGQYYLGDAAHRDCRQCPHKRCEESPSKPDCERKCQSSITVTTSTNPRMTLTISETTSTTTFTKATDPETNASNTPSRTPFLYSPNQWPWLCFVGVVILTFLVCFWLLCLPENPSGNKDLQMPVEDSKFNEQHSLQGSSPTTLTLNICEETPMMTLSQSPATQEHPTPTHRSPVLPESEHRADRQVEQSERWPAIVLYAIIKEVPLRRWKEFLRLLSVADQQLERVELETGLGLGYMEKQYQMLRLWSQHSSASLNDIFLALQYMDLSGCALMLQESLEKLN